MIALRQFVGCTKSIRSGSIDLGSSAESVGGFYIEQETVRAFFEEWQGKKNGVGSAWFHLDWHDRKARLCWLLLGKTESGSAGEQPDKG